jgi:hypothetical protein
VDNWSAPAFCECGKGIWAALFVTFTQQPSFFCRRRMKTPKKAALAAVFGLPCCEVTGLIFRSYAGKTHKPSRTGIGSLRMMSEGDGANCRLN